MRRLGGFIPGFKAAAPIDTMEVELSVNDAHTTSYDTIDFDTVVRDTGGWFDTTNHRWTPTHTGLYIHNVQVRYSTTEQGYYTFYDVTGSAVLLNMQTISTYLASAAYTYFWGWQHWCESGNAYDIRLYTRSASTVLADDDTRLFVTGPLATTGGEM
jgi:hypothetical protein